MGTDYTVRHAAILVAQLPAESRCMRAVEPQLEWTLTDNLLGAIEYAIRQFHYSFTEDAETGENRPEPLFPWAGPEEQKASSGYDPETLKRILNAPREEA